MLTLIDGQVRVVKFEHNPMQILGKPGQ